ncbi:MAG: polyphosphate polymerase domain-containing protein [Lachnospiraceae bacterium]|nr:polyphosphate polymerase domain-containing protein [Lachnospiraceae bacterium]
MSDYRHEYKYICAAQQLEVIRNNICGMMQCDKHAVGNGQYRIRSLYFDDCRDSCLYDNINGNDPREKFRVRIYNQDSSYIRLELKRKEKGKTRKESCRIDEVLCRRMMQGAPLDLRAVDADVYRKFCLWQNTRLLRPKVIVEYDRTAYVYQDGNVRVTFDFNIRSGDAVERFLEEHVAARPVMPLNQHILEVKFDELIPDFIYSAIQIEGLRQTTCSKYYMCRKYNITGGNSR